MGNFPSSPGNCVETRVPSASSGSIENSDSLPINSTPATQMRNQAVLLTSINVNFTLNIISNISHAVNTVVNNTAENSGLVVTDVTDEIDENQEEVQELNLNSVGTVTEVPFDGQDWKGHYHEQQDDCASTVRMYSEADYSNAEVNQSSYTANSAIAAEDGDDITKKLKDYIQRLKQEIQDCNAGRKRLSVPEITIRRAELKKLQEEKKRFEKRLENSILPAISKLKPLKSNTFCTSTAKSDIVVTGDGASKQEDEKYMVGVKLPATINSDEASSSNLSQRRRRSVKRRFCNLCFQSPCCCCMKRLDNKKPKRAQSSTSEEDGK